MAISLCPAVVQLLVNSSPKTALSPHPMAVVGLIRINPVSSSAPRNNLPTLNPIFPVMVAANSSDVFNSDVSGVFGLQTGSGNAAQYNASVIGALFGRQPARPSFSYGMALEPPSASSDSAGQLHWLAADPSAYTGTVTHKNVSTVAPSQVGGGVLSTQSTMTVFDLDKWVVTLSGSGKTVVNAAVQAGLDPYYPGVYFPADQAKLVCELLIFLILFSLTCFCQTTRSPARLHPPAITENLQYGLSPVIQNSALPLRSGTPLFLWINPN